MIKYWSLHVCYCMTYNICTWNTSKIHEHLSTFRCVQNELRLHTVSSIPLYFFVSDELHLFLRIMDILMENLITQSSRDRNKGHQEE